MRDWIHARSKANLTDYTLEQLRKSNFPDANFTRGLGVFGNNVDKLKPTCLSKKYHHWIQEKVHADREMPLYVIWDGRKVADPKERNRAYCCCTNMRTGEVFNNDPEKNCVRMRDCMDTSMMSCKHAFDEELGKEILEQMETMGNK